MSVVAITLLQILQAMPARLSPKHMNLFSKISDSIKILDRYGRTLSSSFAQALATSEVVAGRISRRWIRYVRLTNEQFVFLHKQFKHFGSSTILLRWG